MKNFAGWRCFKKSRPSRIEEYASALDFFRALPASFLLGLKVKAFTPFGPFGRRRHKPRSNEQQKMG